MFEKPARVENTLLVLLGNFPKKYDNIVKSVAVCISQQ